METDIVVEGFRQAEITHGVRYMRLVGDGGSSVLTSIHQRVPVFLLDMIISFITELNLHTN